MQYRVDILQTSKDLPVKERIRIKDTTNAVSLDALTQEANERDEEIIINVDYWAKLHVVSEKAEDGEYDKFVFTGKDGVKYCTSSKSFMDTFLDIYNEMLAAGEEDITIEVYRKESKNYKGKYFLTCSIV